MSPLRTLVGLPDAQKGKPLRTFGWSTSKPNLRAEQISWQAHCVSCGGPEGNLENACARALLRVCSEPDTLEWQRGHLGMATRAASELQKVNPLRTCGGSTFTLPGEPSSPFRLAVFLCRIFENWTLCAPSAGFKLPHLPKSELSAHGARPPSGAHFRGGGFEQLVAISEFQFPRARWTRCLLARAKSVFDLFWNRLGKDTRHLRETFFGSGLVLKEPRPTCVSSQEKKK